LKRLKKNDRQDLTNRSIRLKDAANRYAAKISHETLQERSIRLKNVTKRYAAKNSTETSPERASRLEIMILSRQKANTTAGKI
jgi:hypothetical protein